jgi:hypothetical protein
MRSEPYSELGGGLGRECLLRGALQQQLVGIGSPLGFDFSEPIRHPRVAEPYLLVRNGLSQLLWLKLSTKGCTRRSRRMSARCKDRSTELFCAPCRPRAALAASRREILISVSWRSLCVGSQDESVARSAGCSPRATLLVTGSRKSQRATGMPNNCERSVKAVSVQMRTAFFRSDRHFARAGDCSHGTARNSGYIRFKTDQEG